MYDEESKRAEILIMCATGMCISRDAIFAMLKEGESQETVSHKLLLMVKDRELLRGKLSEKEKGQRRRSNLSNGDRYYLKIKSDSYRISAKGLRYIESEYPKVYEFYKRFTQKGNKSTDKQHIRSTKRAGDIVYLMSRAGVKVGAEKPALMDIENGVVQKLDVSERTFYMRREQKRDVDQKEDKLNSSRACGVMITPCITGLVYRIDNKDYGFSGTIEQSTCMKAQYIVSRLYDVPFSYELKECLFVGDSYEQLLEILSMKTSSSNIKVKNLHDAIAKPELLSGKRDRVNVRFVPFNMTGAELLSILTLVPQDELLHQIFSDEELDIDRAARYDGFISTRELECVEFISCNISKLEKAKQRYAGKLDKLGIVCFDFQKEFVKKFFQQEDGRSVALRVIRFDAFKDMMKGMILDG